MTQDLLPPGYRDGKEVSALPMGSAPVRYDVNGEVAWDEMWTGFCDLALAGGPSHRSTLLEPVTPMQAQADPGNRYAVPYLHAMNGFIYNVDMIKARMPDAPTDSSAMLDGRPADPTPGITGTALHAATTSARNMLVIDASRCIVLPSRPRPPPV